MPRRIALILAFAGACLSLADAHAASSVAYQVNVAHSGVQFDAALAPPFTQRWQVTLPGQVSYPLIAQGRVFVTVSEPTTAASTLYALDQASGQTIWSQPVTQPPPFVYPWANAAYDDGRIFAVGTAGFLTAFDASSGAPLWGRQLPGQYLFSSPPTASNGIVYVGGAGSGGTLYAVDAASGAVLATQSVENGDDSSPAVSDTGVFVSYACNRAYGFELVTLAPKWHYSTSCEGGGGKTVVYESGRVYTRDFFGNLILNAADGNLLGNFGDPLQQTPPIPAVQGRVMWLQRGGTLFAYDVGAPSEPKLLWSFTPHDVLLASAPMVIATTVGEFVIVGSISGNVYAVDAVNGTVVWSANVGPLLPPPDEQNISQPLTGFGAGDGLLVIPAGNTVTAFAGTSPPMTATVVAVPALSQWMLAALAMLIAFATMTRWRPRPRRSSSSRAN